MMDNETSELLATYVNATRRYLRAWSDAFDTAAARHSATPFADANAETKAAKATADAAHTALSNRIEAISC